MNYAKLFTVRKDGSYQGKYKDASGKWHTVCDKDPEKLFYKIEELKKPKPPTFGDLIDAWQEEHDAETAFKTAESYIAPCRRLKEEFGDIPAEEVTPLELQNFLNRMARRKYSKRTVQLHLTVIRLVYQRAVLLGILSVDTSAVLSIPKGLSAQRREVPKDAALAAVIASEKEEMGPFALTLYYTGLRRGEALALRYEDIDRKERIIHVRRALQFTPNFPEVKEPKTEAGVRDVHYPEALNKILPKKKSGPVFPGPDGKSYMNKGNFIYRWQKYCEAIGHDITCHQLRHYYATALYEAGVPVIAAQSQLGHKNASTTMGIYTHLRDGVKNDAYDQIDSYFAKNSK